MRKHSLNSALAGLLLSIFLTVLPVIGFSPSAHASVLDQVINFCTLAFEPKALPRFPLPDNSPRMVTNEQRELLLKQMGGPSLWTRKWILRKYDSSNIVDSRLTQRVRNIRAYLAKHSKWDGYRKAIVWETFVEDMNAENKKPGDREFYCSYHEGSDGSFVFQANGTPAFVISPEGVMYRGHLSKQLALHEQWIADYSQLKVKN